MSFAVEGLCQLVFSILYILYDLGENSYEMKWLNYTHNILKEVSVIASKTVCGQFQYKNSQNHPKQISATQNRVDLK